MTGNRHSIRLQDYDYTQSGMYYVTICVKNHSCLFGKMVNKNMVLNDAGKMAEKIWLEIPLYYNGFNIDMFQIMPNHIHGIIAIVGAGPCACPHPAQSKNIKSSQNQSYDIKQLQNESQLYTNAGQGRAQGPAPTPPSPPSIKLKLSDIIGRFKSLITKRYIDGVKQNNWHPFTGKLWQRDYYEHIIRNAKELNHIRKYIKNNPEASFQN